MDVWITLFMCALLVLLFQHGWCVITGLLTLLLIAVMWPFILVAYICGKCTSRKEQKVEAHHDDK